MNVFQAIAAGLLPFVTGLVNAAEKTLPTLMPGLPGALLNEALSLAPVQAEITKLEGLAVGEVVQLLTTGLDKIKALVVAHVHGKLGAWLGKELNLLPTVNLQPDEWTAIANAVATGNLRKLLGLT